MKKININIKKKFSHKVIRKITILILLVFFQASYFYLPLEILGLKNQIPEAKAANANGRVVYGLSTNTTPRDRAWDGSAFGTENTAAAATANIQWVVNKEAPSRAENIIGTGASTGNISFQVRSSGSWGNLISVGAVGTTNDAQRGFDIAYEEVSGNGMVVYEKDTTSNTAIYYQTWNGSSWSGENTLTFASGSNGNNLWVRLETKPLTNEIMLVTEDTNSDIRAIVWDGSSWVDEQLLTTAATSATTTLVFDLAYEYTSKDALVAYGTGTTWDFWTYSGGTWTDGTNGGTCAGDGTTNACSNVAGAIVDLELSGSNENNYIGVAINETTGDDFSAQMWDGSQWLATPVGIATWDEAGATENAAGTHAIAAGYENNGNRFMFLYVLNGGLNAVYFFYDLDTGLWYNGDGTTSITDIDSATTTTPSWSDDVEWMRLTPNPDDASQIMLSGNDLLFSNRSFLWGGSSWSTPTNSTHGAAAAALMNTVYFAWDRTITALTVGTEGTQNTSLALPSTGNNVGGAFNFIQNTGSNNVTSIKVTETQATTDADTELENVYLYYKQEATCSSTIPGDATQFNSTPGSFSSQAVTVTGTMAVGTSKICVYVKLDVKSTTEDGDLMDIQIANSSTDVISGANVVVPSTAVSISGTTTLETPKTTVATEGTQATTLGVPYNDIHTGGAFSFIRNYTSTNVTSIKITETQATTDADTELADIKVYYKQEGTCSSSIPGDATLFNSTPGSFSSQTVTVTGTMAVGTSKICVYVKLDVLSTTEDGDLMDIQIANPSTDVLVSSETVSPATAISISGTTTLEYPVFTTATEGTQKTEMGIPSDAGNVGGAFSFILDTGSVNVTSIKVTETQATTDADTELSNVIIWYKQEGTCSAVVPVDATQFNSTPGSFSSQTVTVTGTMAVSTSKICVYVKLNVLTTTEGGDLLDIQIANPSTDIATSTPTDRTTSAISISGTTTLTSPDYISYGAPFLYTEANWGVGGAGLDFYYEVYWKKTSGNVYARVYDETSSAVVTDSLVYISSSTFVRTRTSVLTLTDGHVYRAQLGHVTGDSGEVYSARLLTPSSGGGADLAEYYGSDEALELGEVVAIDSAKIAFVKGSTTRYQKDLLGIVSTQPGIILGANIGQSYPIALVGRVPVKVTTENGTIKTGDFVTSSSTKGFGMKAIVAGRVLGQALETFDLTKTYPCPSGIKKGIVCGTVMVFVNLTNYLGQSIDMAMTESPSANLSVLGLNVTPDSQTSTQGLSSTDSNIFIPSYNAPDKESQILAFLERNQEQASSSSSLSEIFTGRISASSSIITPQIITDILYAKTIKADRIEGLEILTNQISILNSQVSVLSTATQSSELATNSANVNLSGLNLNLAATASADFNIKGNSLVEGMLMVLKSITTPNLLVSDFASFFGDVLFKKNVSIEGRATFNSDTAGFAVVNKGERSVEVNFDDEYISTPVIAVSIALNKGTDDALDKKLEDAILNGNISYVITQRTTKGFVIRLNQTATSDIDFSWIAISVKNAKTQRLDLKQTSVSFDPVSTQSAAFQSILNQLNNQ